MIPRIKELQTAENYLLIVKFDDGKSVVYDMLEDMQNLPNYNMLQVVPKLFEQVKLDESRTCVYWTDDIDLPSDIIYEYGKEV